MGQKRKITIRTETFESHTLLEFQTIGFNSVCGECLRQVHWSNFANASAFSDFTPGELVGFLAVGSLHLQTSKDGHAFICRTSLETVMAQERRQK